MNNNERHSATQALIQKYYDYMLGLPNPITNSDNKDKEIDQPEDSNDNSLLRRRFITNLIRHTRSRHSTALDETDAETDTERGTLTKYNGGNRRNHIVKFNGTNIKDGPVDDNEELYDDNDDYDDDEEANLTILEKMKNVLYAIFVGDYEKDLLIERVGLQKKHAMTFKDWRNAALELDTLTNKTDWKRKRESTLYDYQLIEDVTRKLKESRLNKDYAQLIYIIRTNWVRNLGNMGNVNLYRHSYVGTNYLIDDYIEES